MASGNSGGTITIWDLSSNNQGQIIRNLTHHVDWVNSLKLLNDRTTLVSASDDETIKIWNYQSGQLLRTLSRHTNYVRTLAILSDNRLASGSWDKTVKIWSTTSWELLRSISVREEVKALAFLINSENLACIFYSSIMNILNPSTGNVVRIISNQNRSVKFTTVESFRDDSIAIGQTNGQISVYNSSNGEIVRVLQGHRDAVWALRVFGDENVLASGANDGNVRFWRVGKWGESIGMFKAHDYWIVELVVSSDASCLISAASCYAYYCPSSFTVSGEIKIWN